MFRCPRSLILLLLLAAASGLQAQNIGDEIPVSALRFDSPAIASPNGWDAAFSDDAGYAVWVDYPYTYGIALTADGTTIPGTRRFIGQGILPPKVIAARGAFYVAFWDGTTTHIERSDGSEETAIASGPWPNIGWNGSHFLLTYVAGFRLLGQLFDEDLRPVGTPVVIDDNPYQWVSEAIASAAGSFLVTWTTAAGERAALVDDDGRITPITALLPPTANTLPIATNGTDYLLLFPWNDLTAVRVGADGSVSDPLPIAGKWQQASVASDGTNYFVLWSDRQSNYFLSTVTGDRVGEPQPFPIQAYDAKIFAGGRTPFVAWLDGTFAGTIFGHRLGDAATHVISIGAANQQTPSIASDGFEALAVWSQDGRVVAGRTRLDGVPLDAYPIPIASLGSPFYTVAPKIAFDGVDYLIVWTDGGAALGRLLSRDGKFVSGVLHFSNTATPASIDVAWLGDDYFVAWAGSTPGAAVVTSAGLTVPVGIFPADATVKQVAVASNDTGEAVVAYTTGDSTGFGTVLRTLVWRGDVLHQSVIATFDESPNTANPRLASSGSKLILTWMEAIPASGQFAGKVAHLDSAGALEGQPLNLATSPINYRGVPLLAAWPLFDGIRFEVIVNVASTNKLFTVLDDDIVQRPLPDAHVTGVASAGNGRFLFAYDRQEASEELATRWRSYFRVVEIAASQPRRRAAP